MATITNNAAASIVNLKGRGKAQREAAYLQIAPLSFVENKSRVETIANLRTALGANPTADEAKAAQTEWTIGRIASRLPASEFPKDVKDNADRLEFARLLVTSYAAPTNNKKAKLRAGKIGWRSEVQHKTCRAADEAWSQVKAELGIGAAQTQKEKNDKKAAKRSTNANPVRGAAKSAADNGKVTSAIPNHSELVQPAKPISADDACAFVHAQASTLLGYANKHARLLPTDFGTAIQAFKSAINKAMNDHETRKAIAEAAKAEKMK